MNVDEGFICNNMCSCFCIEFLINGMINFDLNKYYV